MKRISEFWAWQSERLGWYIKNANSWGNYQRVVTLIFYVTSALTKEQRSKVSGGWWSYAAEVLRPAITNQREGAKKYLLPDKNQSKITFSQRLRNCLGM